MNGAASGTSRRAFLGRAAGAAAAVAGAGVGAGALTQSAAAAAPRRSYTAGRFALDIDGSSVGKFGGLDGGDLDGDVALDGLGPDLYQKKHIAGVKYEDFTLQIGSGMGKGMYNWIKDSFDKGYVRKSGAIIAADFNYREKSRHEASTMSLSSVTIPALDGSSKDAGYLAVNVACPKVTTRQGSGQGVLGQKQKAWLTSNFVFEVGGVDTSRVASIDSFTWKCTVASDGSVSMDVSDIGVTFPRATLSSWKEWYQSMISGGDDERDGALTLIGAQNGAVVTFQLGNLGLYRLSPVGGSNRVKAELYCERMRVLPTVNK